MVLEPCFAFTAGMGIGAYNHGHIWQCLEDTFKVVKKQALREAETPKQDQHDEHDEDEEPKAEPTAEPATERKALALHDGIRGGKDTLCFISFPGKYQDDWNNLVGWVEMMNVMAEQDSEDGTFRPPLSTACIFLPDGHTWSEFPVAFTTEALGLGGSQRGEVAYAGDVLEKEGMAFRKCDVDGAASEALMAFYDRFKTLLNQPDGIGRVCDAITNCEAARRGIRDVVIGQTTLNAHKIADLFVGMAKLTALKHLAFTYVHFEDEAAAVELGRSFAHLVNLTSVEVNTLDLRDEAAAASDRQSRGRGARRGAGRGQCGRVYVPRHSFSPAFFVEFRKSIAHLANLTSLALIQMDIGTEDEETIRAICEEKGIRLTCF
uniref:Uncharacterized protein n=2 Tax=Alexandrium monilatum TaxID=311494 RepID=A0A7S4SRA1_9DINO